jgi:hypothetical protein
MTSSTSGAAGPGGLGDDDIRAFSAPAVAAATPPAPAKKPRRVWPWLLLAAALLAVLGAVVLAVNLVGSVGHGWHVSVDDDLVFDGVGSVFGGVLAVAITALVLLLVGGFLAVFLPMVLVLVLGIVALVVGVPLLLILVLALIAGALLLSPLWLPVALLVWWLS